MTQFNNKMSKVSRNWRIIKVKSLSTMSKDPNPSDRSNNLMWGINDFAKWMNERMKSFCKMTALHGYSHIVRDDIAFWERVLWTIICIGALFVSIILLYITWVWNEETPTVTVIESTHFATWNIPFPAVSLCGTNKISATAALAMASSMIRPNGMSVRNLSELFRLAVHFEGVGQATETDYLQLDEVLRANNISVDKLTRDLAPRCDEMMERCMWKGTQTRCDTLFQAIRTSMGYCCSFNYFGLTADNFPPKLSATTIKKPRSVTAVGADSGLTIIINPRVEDFHSAVLNTFGFRVLIHDSYDFADDNSETKLVASNLEAYISISPEETYSTADVYKLAKNQRKCLHADEPKLNVMQKYSYVNCVSECRANLMYKFCGCVPYNLPNNGSKLTCEMSHFKCFSNYQSQIITSVPGSNTPVVPLSEVQDWPCDCLPDCELTMYPTEISSGELNRKFSFNDVGFFRDIQLRNHTLLHVYFKDLISTHYRNDMYQNWLGTLASFGGLLGLFVGFSLITLMELIYFFTFRMIFDKFSSL